MRLQIFFIILTVMFSSCASFDGKGVPTQNRWADPHENFFEPSGRFR